MRNPFGLAPHSQVRLPEAKGSLVVILSAPRWGLLTDEHVLPLADPGSITADLIALPEPSQFCLIMAFTGHHH